MTADPRGLAGSLGSPITIQARQIGRTAADLLAAHGCAGRVLAVVSNAVYFLTDSGELFWLARSGLPMHGRAILAEFAEGLLRVGMTFGAGGGCLQVAGRLTVDCTRAMRWVPALVAPERTAACAVVCRRVRGLQRFGLTSLPIAGIERACRGRNMAALAAASCELIGLGPGLTPAGDDLVGGVLFAAHHLRVAHPLSFPWRQEPIDDLLRYARPRTNPISYALMSDHARGEGVEPLHNLVAALLDLQERPDLDEHAHRLLRIGGTTGAEMLAGALTGLLLIAE